MHNRNLALIFAFIGGVQAAPAWAVSKQPAVNNAAQAAKPAARASTDPYGHLGGMRAPISSMKQAVLLSLFHPEVFETLGGDSAHGGPPSGVLITGVRGVGKSELAKATRQAVLAKGGAAVMTDVTGIKPADIKALFANAIKIAKGIPADEEEKAKPEWDNAKPVALFLDEIHKLGSEGDKRSENVAMMNAMLDLVKKEMAANPKMKRISVIGVTSEPDQVDHSLTRKGKLEVPVKIEMPEEEERLDVLTKLTSGARLKPATKALLARIAKDTRGWTPSDLARVTRQASYNAALRENPEADVTKLTHSTLAAMEIHPADIEHAMKQTQPETATTFGVKTKDVTLDDVVGQDEAKAQVREIIANLQNPEKAKKLGAKLERIYVLVGPPGVGKTMTATAMANEIGMPLLTLGTQVKGGTVGATENGIDSVFQTAKQMGNAMIFMDEAEGLLKARGSNPGDPTHDNGVDVVLAATDGVESRKGRNVIVILATNHPEMLDPAIFGPNGRAIAIHFHALSDKHIEQQYARLLEKVDAAPDVTPAKLAKLTSGLAGRGVDKVMSQAGSIANARGADAVSMQDYEEAVRRVMPHGSTVSAAKARSAAPVQRMLGVETP